MYNFNQAVNYIIISLINLVLVILGEVLCAGKKWLADDKVKLVEIA
ncbi:hypothetical protein CLNEO_27210 [Anaerotignum neopropionicum]|uniref:Uncharacterized protein n=1 Tax=Anaerotignum neopropionicum TaxID=36847 RepID=A0A136WBF9_9FIRM|nr:hypothetical protein [Anaerotignum neopropionicum]KXL51864.1 hypothetical protein CLNEO_27210 [Anaerotignum neopropionicum]